MIHLIFMTGTASAQEVADDPASPLPIVGYLISQGDSLDQWMQTKRDSLAARPDTSLSSLKDHYARTRQRATSLLDSIPVQPTDLPGGAILRQEVTKILPAPTVPKVTSQLPTLPKLSTEGLASFTTKLPQLGKATSSLDKLSAINPSAQGLEGQLLASLPEGQLLRSARSVYLPTGQAGLPGKGSLAATQLPATASPTLTSFQHAQVKAARTHLAQHQPQVQQAQKVLSKLKKKYNMMQGDVKQKRSSLQGTPLGKRLVYGGTMQLQRLPNLTVDLSPHLAYRWIGKPACVIKGVTVRV